MLRILVAIVAGNSPYASLMDLVNAARTKPGVHEKLANLGNDPLDMLPEEFARFVRQEIDTYSRVIRNAGIKLQ